ncbi:MAG: hypothetical protein ACHQYQ_10485, partial [Bacteriovoracales bacterium]
MFQKYLLLIIIFFSNAVFSAPISYQTTRLKSTGGAGVGSILMDEATFLNPAPLAFFNLTAVFIQRTGGDETTNGNDETNLKSENYAAVLSDSKSQVKGSFSYVKAKQGDDKSSMISASTAFPIQQRSAIG